MKAIDELRSMRGNYAMYEDLVARCCEIADEIERELEEEYVPLPKDADGVPIRMGDTVRFKPDGEPFEVRHIRYHANFETEVGDGERWGDLVAAACVHYNPPTVEDVLEEALNKAANLDRQDGYWPSAADITNIVNEVAPKLRLRDGDE